MRDFADRWCGRRPRAARNLALERGERAADQRNRAHHDRSHPENLSSERDAKIDEMSACPAPRMLTPNSGSSDNLGFSRFLDTDEHSGGRSESDAKATVMLYWRPSCSVVTIVRLAKCDIASLNAASSMGIAAGV